MDFIRTRDARLVRSFFTDADCMGPSASFVVATEPDGIAQVLFMLCASKEAPTTADVFWWVPKGSEDNLRLDKFMCWVWKETSLKRVILHDGAATKEARRPFLNARN